MSQTLEFHTLAVIDDRDGNYEIPRPTFHKTKDAAIDYAVRDFKRFIGTEWGKYFKKLYHKAMTAKVLEKFLSEEGIFVLFDDSGNFRRIYKIDRAELAVSLEVA